MKVLQILILAVSVALFSCGEAQSQKQIKNYSAAEFKKEIETNPNVIVLDVRTPEEVAAGTIGTPSVINFYDNDFAKKIALMDKSKTIAVYCKSGGRSGQAAKVLADNGFNNVINLDGGITGWERQGLPITKMEGATDVNIKQMSEAEFNQLINSAKIVLVDFHTKWCAPCRKMAPLVDELEKEYLGKASVKRVDCDQSKEVVSKLDISGVPVFVIFKNGKEVWRKSGAMPKEDLQKAVNSFL
ncbi:MAG: thioredoxin fold domain-containing protein [Bacteroidia bacterium]|nr:thioredoxin fold domain-containing protein [Bacteroidia bacterium]